MKRILLLCTALFTLSLTGFAQYNSPQNKKWAFGSGSGLDFTSGSPVAISSSMSSGEGCASVCDATGNMLFYTEGTVVWDRTGAIMPSGSAIVSFTTSSSTQGALIAPVVGNPNQYYVFSLEDFSGSTGYCHLDYCIVDMTLNSGLGDVIAASIGTTVTSSLAEKMILVSGNSCNVWLVTHMADTAKFLSYSISASGIASPIVSNVGTFAGTNSYTIGVLKISPDRQHIVSQVYPTSSTEGTELFDFDPNTGIVSNCRVLDNSSAQYGADFSPNSTKLYCQEWSGTVDQYDITGGTAAAIIATRTTIISSATYSDIKLAPDNKMYIRAASGSGQLDCISSPNTGGTACGYVASAVTLTGSVTLGLPNTYVLVSGGGDTITRVHDTAVCLPPGGIVITADTVGVSYQWNTGVTASTCNITAYGTYWVAISNGCHINIDTFHIASLPQDTVFHSRDTSVCSSIGAFTLTAPTGYTGYLWNTGATTSTLSVSTAGDVFVYCSIGCHLVIDTVHVSIIPFVHDAGVVDTSYCFPGSLILTAPGGYAAYLWQDGSTNGTFTATAAGTYYVVSSAYCRDRVDTFHVLPASLSFSLGPDVTVCMNYLIVPPVTGPDVTYLWQDGSKGSFYSASRTGNYSVTIHKGNCVAHDDINVEFFHFSQNIRDTFICKGEPINLDLVANPPVGGKVLWNDGTTNPIKTVHESGTYWVYVSMNECEILDTVHVVTGFCSCWHNVPSAFTPNGDGLNDMLRPTIQPGCNISGYQFSIFNRWGEQVFTSDIPGKGWDGMYKGEPADMGVYMYSLQFFTSIFDKQSAVSGTITLIR